jgi:hypothetical protein
MSRMPLWIDAPAELVAHGAFQPPATIFEPGKRPARERAPQKVTGRGFSGSVDGSVPLGHLIELSRKFELGLHLVCFVFRQHFATEKNFQQVYWIVLRVRSHFLPKRWSNAISRGAARQRRIS